VGFAYPAAHLPFQRAAISIDSRPAVGTQAAPVVGMQNPQSSWFSNHSSASSVLEHAIKVVELSRPLVESTQRRDRDLASQLRRAISSIALNVAEGLGNSAGNARLRFESARGSLKEAQAGIQVAVAWGYISAATAQPVLESMNCLGGRVYGLVRR
jgi:four helix bundle protein